MEDWKEFAETTQTVYGVDMSVLEADFDREQHEYYILSSRWAELGTGCLLAEPQVVKEFDMHVCTLEDARGVGIDSGVPLDFDIVARAPGNGGTESGVAGPVSGFAGWFTVDFRSRTDEAGMGVAPEMANPSYLSTGPEMGCECSLDVAAFVIALTRPLTFGVGNLHLRSQTRTGVSRCSTCSPRFPFSRARPRAFAARWR